VIAALPTEGAAAPRPEDRPKLEAAASVLDYHQRHDVIHVQIIDVQTAFIGLHARSVLLVSTDTLNVVNAEELSGLFAHEIGHEYVWDAYAAAMQQNNDARMQELEFQCDGIAVLTLAGLGIDAERLITALRKLEHYNEHHGTEIAEAAGRYPSQGQREHFIHLVADLVRHTREPGSWQELSRRTYFQGQAAVVPQGLESSKGPDTAVQRASPIRSDHRRVMTAIEDATRRSITFRSLVHRLAESDLIIYVQSGHCGAAQVLSCIAVTRGAGIYRYVRITIDTDHSRQPSRRLRTSCSTLSKSPPRLTSSIR
jgi:hypothetical protein